MTEFGERYRDAIETGARALFTVVVRESWDEAPESERKEALMLAEAVLLAATVETPCPDCQGSGVERIDPNDPDYDEDCEACGGSGVLRVLPTNGDE
jgi:excinuclease UvrABC ATPase subunit